MSFDGAARACLARVLLPVARASSLDADEAQAGPSRRTQLAVIAEHVLVTTDGSPLANNAVPMAIAAVRACGSRQISLLRVLTNPDEGVRPVQALEWELARAHAQTHLRQVAAQFGSLAERVEPVVTEGRAAEEILRFIDKTGVDLVVMAAHGSHESRCWRMGSVARKVVASGRASVLVVPSNGEVRGNGEGAQIHRVLLPLDSSTRAECVLPLVNKIVEVHQAEIILAHVVSRPVTPHRLPTGARDRELIEELTQRSSQRAEAYLHSVRERLVSNGARVNVQLLIDDHPGRAIEQLAIDSGADLLLLSAHGSSADEHEAYGSLARRLLDTVVKPLWIVQDLPQARAQTYGEHSGSVHA